MITSPTQRGAIAARMPSGTPITAATPTATNPTNSVVREPTMIWLRTSRPNLSVPSQCWAEGVSSREVGSTSVGSYGVHTNETSAMTTTTSTSTPPTTRLGLSRRPDPRPAAGPCRRSGARSCRPPRSRGSRASVEQVDHEVDHQDGDDEHHHDVLDEMRSRLATASSSRLPRPGMTNTRSTTTAPISSVASCSPSTVTIGHRGVAQPVPHQRRHRPQALGPRGAQVVLAQHVEHRAAHVAGEHRALHQPERQRRQHQLLGEHRRGPAPVASSRSPAATPAVRRRR